MERTPSPSSIRGRVLPAAILFYVVDVLICQIHAAGKAHPAINDQNFAVVAVVVVGGDEGRDRREHLALDAQRFQPAGVIPRQGGELAGAVIHHPHIHPLRRLAGQHFQNAAPHQAFIHDEIFQKDVLFCRFQLAQHFIEHSFAAVEVGGHRIGIDRKAAALAPADTVPAAPLRVPAPAKAPRSAHSAAAGRGSGPPDPAGGASGHCGPHHFWCTRTAARPAPASAP